MRVESTSTIPIDYATSVIKWMEEDIQKRLSIKDIVPSKRGSSRWGIGSVTYIAVVGAVFLSSILPPINNDINRRPALVAPTPTSLLTFSPEMINQIQSLRRYP